MNRAVLLSLALFATACSAVQAQPVPTPWDAGHAAAVPAWGLDAAVPVDAETDRLRADLAAARAALVDAEGRAASLQGQLARKNAELAGRSGELATHGATLQARDAELAARDAQIAALQTQLQAASGELERERRQQQAQIERLQHDLWQLGALGPQLDMALAQLGQAQAEADHHARRAASLRQDNQQLEAQLAEARRAGTAAHADAARIRQLEADLQAARAQLTQARTDLLNAQRQAASSDASLAALKEQLARGASVVSATRPPATEDERAPADRPRGNRPGPVGVPGR